MRQPWAPSRVCLVWEVWKVGVEEGVGRVVVMGMVRKWRRRRVGPPL